MPGTISGAPNIKPKGTGFKNHVVCLPLFAVFVDVVFTFYSFPRRGWQTTVLVASSIYFYTSD